MRKLVYIVLFISVCSALRAQDIRVQGKVEFNFSKHCSIRAGEDYRSYLTSDDDAVNIDIKKLKKNSYWTVAVSKRDIDWDNRVKIYVCRSSSGNANGKKRVWGGTYFQRVRNLPCYFFSGYEKVNNIDIQYQLRGLSSSIESKTYYTEIVYTLYED